MLILISGEFLYSNPHTTWVNFGPFYSIDLSIIDWDDLIKPLLMAFTHTVLDHVKFWVVWGSERRLWGFRFCKKDLYNYLNNEGRERINGGDAFVALIFFLQAKADNEPMFFTKFTTTDKRHLENLFCSDSTI